MDFNAWGIQTRPFAAQIGNFFPKIFNFSTFILGGQLLLPQRANKEKSELFQLQNWMRQRDSSAWGIQYRPCAAHYAHLVPKDFQLFHFHTGRPIIITPDGQ